MKTRCFIFNKNISLKSARRDKLVQRRRLIFFTLRHLCNRQFFPRNKVRYICIKSKLQIIYEAVVKLYHSHIANEFIVFFHLRIFYQSEKKFIYECIFVRTKEIGNLLVYRKPAPIRGKHCTLHKFIQPHLRSAFTFGTIA